MSMDDVERELGAVWERIHVLEHTMGMKTRQLSILIEGIEKITESCENALNGLYDLEREPPHA